MKTLVLGLGNPILGDDAIGLKAVALVRRRLPAGTPIEVDEDYWGGLRLMERLIGYDRAILIDAIHTGLHRPGTILRMRPEDLPTRHTASAHDVDLPTALRLAAAMGLKMPGEIRIVAVEAERLLQFDEECSPALLAALPELVDIVLLLIRAWNGCAQMSEGRSYSRPLDGGA